MRIHVLFPTYRSGSLTLEQMRLVRALQQADSTVSHACIKEACWSPQLGDIRFCDLNSLHWDSRLMELMTQCPAATTRVVFDVRRVHGDVPVDTCAYMCAMAYRSSSVSAMVTEDDEPDLRGVLPAAYSLPPAMFSRPSLAVSYYRSLQAS